ncbi:expressed unknown protein [Seminavis robusta]|uniref:Uncharacterized protein n=1 Tax=Seminavis robusta TaxID=568900 RepID=A0A9N8E9F1_9STRA|nr:expressed unknown protein [Seminavis robusta]|eukprot:Sro693_g188300.1 n/a (107) ;mRNA; f:28291-28611
MTTNHRRRTKPSDLRSLLGVDLKVHIFSHTLNIVGHCSPFQPLYTLNIELGTPEACGGTQQNTDDVADPKEEDHTSPMLDIRLTKTGESSIFNATQGRGYKSRSHD